MFPLPYGLIFSLCAAIVCFACGRRSTGAGMVALLTVGYAYGILRANLLDGFSYFIFDAGLFGFYLVRFTMAEEHAVLRRSDDAMGWLRFLIGWPLLLFLLPIHHILVQLVGLRHIIFFLPMILIGARARERDLDMLATALACLNGVAFVFTLLEYQYGIQPFFPRSATTDIMYRSHDIHTAEGTFHRLPATFTSAHAYGGTLFMTMPFLFNQLVNPAKNARFRLVMGAACAISVIGMFMAGPRLPLIQLVGSALILLILPGLTSSERFRLGWRIAAVAAVAFIYVAADPRMQRFTTLSDPKMVEERATMSLNFSLGESFQKLPMGVGLGGAAGSSMPYFLKDVAPIPIGAENEYARIAIEQGIVGFLIWMAFVLRLVVRPPKPLTPRWRTGLFFAWATVLVAWGTAWIGLGMLQSIPASIILLFSSGMLLRSSPRKVPAPAQSPLPERFQPAPLPGASNPMLPPGGI